MARLDPTAGPHHRTEEIVVWLHTLATLHQEHERSPKKLAQIEAYQQQAQGWLRARRERAQPADPQKQQPFRRASVQKPRERRPRVLSPQPAKP